MDLNTIQYKLLIVLYGGDELCGTFPLIHLVFVITLELIEKLVTNTGTPLETEGKY